MFYALIVKSVPENIIGRKRRRLEEKALLKPREVVIDGDLFLDEFSKLSLVDQFNHLKPFIPAGWRPIDFKDRVDSNLKPISTTPVDYNELNS